MIISENPKPELEEFKALMTKTDKILNSDAQKRPEYYSVRNGNVLEDDVMAALEEGATGTAFAHTIIKVSGQRFPDIIASKYYGVEVKSTKEDNWTSTGSSILESTRVPDVERIYMTFGKLGGTPTFLSKPYEECLSGIAVTHMPRYLIDMRLSKEETIFAKMGIPYDDLRNMDNPVKPVSQYYRSKLKAGESLWWAGDAVDEPVSAKIRLWSTLTSDEKKKHTVYGLVNYPEVVGGTYDRYALWLTSQGVVDPHIRDQFSAGGQEEMLLSSGIMVKFPGVYRRIKNNKDYFVDVISRENPSLLEAQIRINTDEYYRRLEHWCDLASRSSTMKYELSMDALKTLFFKDKR